MARRGISLPEPGMPLFHDSGLELDIGGRTPSAIDRYIEKRRRGERVVAMVTGLPSVGSLRYAQLQQSLAHGNSGRFNNGTFEIINDSDAIAGIFGERSLDFVPENILNRRAYELDSIRKGAYGKISEIVNDQPDKDFVVVGHMTFDWDNVELLGYHPSFFGRLRPDIFINVIDNEVDIARRLNGESTEHRKQWGSQRMTEERVINWMTGEFNHTKMWADFLGVPWYVVTRFMSPTTLYMLLYHPEGPWMYYAQQMTHAKGDGETYDKADELFCTLMRMGPVTNPKGYEIQHFDGDHLHTSKFTDVRDTEWFVQQNRVVVAYYHRPDGSNGPTPSEGVADECMTAFRCGKHVYRIWPSEYCSPFVRSNSHRVFRSAGECLGFLEKEHGPPLGFAIPNGIVDDAFSVNHSRRNILPPNAYTQ